MTEEEEEIILERVYTIPLRKAWVKPRVKRAKGAVQIVKKFLLRHMKTEEVRATEVKIDPSLNELIWARGAKKPPRRVRVRAVMDRDGVVKAYPAEES